MPDSSGPEQFDGPPSIASLEFPSRSVGNQSLKQLILFVL
jgi:hypothetical protein